MAGNEQDAVRALASPLAAQRGLDLVDVEIKGGGGKRLVRVIVDRKGGVELADCHKIASELSEALDAEDPVEGRYSLEVTSPGVDRPLADRDAFDRVEGRVVLVHRNEPDGTKEVRGTVVEAAQDAVVLDVKGQRVAIRYDDIHKAKQALPW